MSSFLFCFVSILFLFASLYWQAGFVNGLKFSSDGLFLAAAIGQEHRLGRWWRLKAAKNALCLISLDKRQEPEPTPVCVTDSEHAAKKPGRARGGKMKRAGLKGKRTIRKSARI